MASDKVTFQGSRQWFTHLAQYTVVGGLAAVCDVTVFTVLANFLGINYLAATAVSFIAGTVVNFLACHKFVFRLSGHSLAVAWWRKLFSGCAALLVNLFLMYLLVDLLGFGRMRNEDFLLLDGLVLARGIAIGASFFLNFLLTKYYAFRDY